MADDFQRAVEEGLKLSKRVYLGKDRAVVPPMPQPGMEKSPHWCLPTAPMVYAVITDPGIVDNPDIPSYQPYVHGRCDPPSLIPLQMNGIELEVDCYMDTAFIRVSGSWRVHCVMGSRACDCRIVVPMGEQGSILGVEVDHRTKTNSTELIPASETTGIPEAGRSEGGFLLPHIFTLTVAQIDGGSNLSIKLQWSQKLLYNDGQFTVSVPFTFPPYVTPAVKITKKQLVQLNVNSGIGGEIICNTSSHPLKETCREAGKLGFIYEAQVLSWSKIDFNFSYKVSSSHISGGILLQSPPPYDVDQREIFCFYLLPGEQESKKVFKKDVIFVVDISGSMGGKPLQDTKTAISAALLKLGPTDSFNIIAFNNNVYSFSTSLEYATPKAIEKANEWLGTNLVAEGGTDISLSLNKAITMLSDTQSSTPIIYFITDGAVKDERHICHSIKSQIKEKVSMFPRIYTFGIGTFCNHYFLQTLATVSRGQYDYAYDLDSIEPRMLKLFYRGLSATLANVTIDTLDDLNMEVFPSSCIPDLSSEYPLTICGRYKGNFPDTIKMKGLLGDSSSFVQDLKAQPVKIPLERILAKQQIDLYTAQAWLSEDKLLEEKVSKMSIYTGVISECTRMIVTETSRSPQAGDSSGVSKAAKKGDTDKFADSKAPKKILLPKLSVGYGDLSATAENTHPGCEQPKLPEAAEIFVKATSDCCGKLCNRCCCMCCISCCSKMNDQCVIVLTQLCTVLACFGCFECCTLCCGGD